MITYSELSAKAERVPLGASGAFFRRIYVFNVACEQIYQKIIGKFQTLFVNDVFDIMSFYKFSI